MVASERTVIRRGYLDRLSEFRDQTDVVKVLTGIRRCGKSTLLCQYMELLKDSGVPSENILYFNMESMTNYEYRDPLKLHSRIVGEPRQGMTYILLDEVNNIDRWQELVSSLMVDIRCDIYLTGSNAYMLSTEISTLITGRTVQIRVLPLSFKEFCELDPPTTLAERSKRFSEYLHKGGMPFIRPEYSEDTVFQRLGEIKSDIILKDICNRKKKMDANKVRRTVDYLFSEIGNPISTDTVSKELDMSTSTAGEYLGMAAEALLFSVAERYDLKGREVLKSLAKYYCTDLGMRNTQPIRRDRDQGRVLENVVYLELVRRGFEVYVGKVGEYEIDFFARKGTREEYYQVSATLTDPKTAEREYRPFSKVRSAGRKVMLTADPVIRTTEDGVETVNIIDWLSEDRDGGKGVALPLRPSPRNK